ncbi:MAG TPA: hypothetical protein PLU67_05615 [Candidatus Kapabacteria bacterium]|nr:hypothetical protein [Candidatus Kapabacteria bacterium]
MIASFRKIISKIEYLVFTLFVFLPILFSCTDPVGIDENVIKTPFRIDTLIQRDTIHHIDSIYIIRIDTVINYKDTIIHKTDTIYLPADNPSNSKFIPKRVDILISEKYFKPGDSPINAIWHIASGYARVFADTSLSVPVIYASINLVNGQNNFNIPGLNRQEMAKEINVRYWGFVLVNQIPIEFDGEPASNKYGILALRSREGNYRYIHSNEQRFTIEQFQEKKNGKGKIVGTMLKISTEYQSNSLRTSFEMFIDIDF